MFTLQDCFNAAWHHFIENQNPPSVVSRTWDDNSYMPAYNNGTNKCAIGLLTDDLKDWDGSIEELFTPGPENEKFKSLVEQFDVDLSSEESIESWQEAQNKLHDFHIDFESGEWVCSFEELKDNYIRFAHEHALDIPNEH